MGPCAWWRWCWRRGRAGGSAGRRRSCPSGRRRFPLTWRVPSYGGRRGHPGGFARAAWAALREAPLSLGARAVLADHSDWVVHVPADEGCVSGIDTREDYERRIGLLRLG